MPYNISMLNKKRSPFSLTFITFLVSAGNCADFKHASGVCHLALRYASSPSCSNPIYLIWLTVAHFHLLEWQRGCSKEICGSGCRHRNESNFLENPQKCNRMRQKNSSIYGEPSCCYTNSCPLCLSVQLLSFFSLSKNFDCGIPQTTQECGDS